MVPVAHTSDHVRWIRTPELREPVMVAAFTGWNDAGDAASNAVRHLVEHWQATPLAEIDPEEYTDFATVRPHVRLSDGSRRLIWPTVGLWSATTPGADLILVLGPEPALRWRSFSDQILAIAERFSVRTLITLGALLADVSHRREVQVLGTAGDDDTTGRHQLQRSRYEGPTGIVGVLGNAATENQMHTVSLWAAVPAYASQVPSPIAAAALVRRAADIIGTPAPVLGLDAEATRYAAAVEELLEADADLNRFVSQLDTYDDTADAFDDDDEDDDDDDDDEDDEEPEETGGDGVQLSFGADDVEPDPAALVEEVERFLRDQRPD